MAEKAQTTPEGLSFGREGTFKDVRQMCKYGENCYQRNPMHHQKFRHPSKSNCNPCPDKNESKNNEDQKENLSTDCNTNNVQNDETDIGPPSCKKSKIAEKLEKPCEKEEMTSEIKSEFDGDILPIMSTWPKDPRKRIEIAFSGKIVMPEDFYEFFEFCYGLNRVDPLNAIASTCGLKLVGPFEFLDQKSKSSDTDEKSKDNNCETKPLYQNDLICHWRYKYDVPEFQTILASVDEKSSFHIGYFRDDPKQMPVFVASSGGIKKDEKFNLGLSSHTKLTLMGDNIFGALYNYIQKEIQIAEPFKQTSLQKMKQAIHVHATIKTQEVDYPLEIKTSRMKARDKNKLSATFHGAGLVVPYNKKTEVGYREIPETTQSLKKILNDIVETQNSNDDKAKNIAFDKLQELVTNVQFANDEGDPGMGLELGINAFLYCSKPLDSTVKHLLSVAYELLGRDFYRKIISAHLHRRKSDTDMFKAF